MALVFLNFSDGVKTRPWQHLPRFARTFQRANDFMPFIWKASEVPVFERVYSCKVQIFWKIHDQKCSFSLKPKKMLIGILKWFSRKTFPLGQLTWIVEFDVGMITFIAHFWKRKLDLIRQQNISTGIDQYLFLAGSFVFFRHNDLTHTALIQDFFHVCQRNWARDRTGYMLKLATTQKSRLAAQMTSAVHAKNHVEKKKLCLQGNDTN